MRLNHSKTTLIALLLGVAMLSAPLGQTVAYASRLGEGTLGGTDSTTTSRVPSDTSKEESSAGTEDEDTAASASSDKTDEEIAAEEEAERKKAEAEQSAQDKKDAAQGDISDLNSQISKLNEEKKKLASQLAAAKTEKEKAIVTKNQLDRQIAIANEEISLMTKRINLLMSDIEDKESQIGDKQVDINDNLDKYKQRLRSMYMRPKASTLGLLLGADSFSDFLSRGVYIDSISKHDSEIIDQLIGDLNAIEEAKAQVDQDKKDVEQSKKDMDAQKAQLSVQLSSAKQQIYSIEQQEKEYLANQAKIAAEMKQAEAELQKIYASLKSDPEYVGGEFTHPVPTLRNITSYYGWRFNNTDFHTGVDFAGSNAYGSSVIASNSGKVSYVNMSYSPGVGYGIYIIVDHGGGKSTRYAHLSKVNVSVGDVVIQGQKIAEVGSTGWSTGPHLHFEIRENGVHKNPLNYLGKK